MTNDEWLNVVWNDLEPGDFTRKTPESPIFKVEARSGPIFTLGRPGSNQTGRPKLTNVCQVRIISKGRKTKAGLRLALLEDATVRLLKEQLGAEFVAFQEVNPGSKKFTPWVFGERYSPGQLASHLFQFHALAVPEVPKDKELKAELLATHKEFHAAYLVTDAGRRLPHIHNESEYRKALG